MKNPYNKHEQIIKALILNWYKANGKEYDVKLTNQFKK